MSEEDRERAALAESAESAAQPDEEEDDDEASSPFDHPAFLPVLLWALSIWFGYDGWLNSDPDMQDHLMFNRVGFGLLVSGALYYTLQAVREQRASESDPAKDSD